MPKVSKTSKLRRVARRVVATSASLDVPMNDSSAVTASSATLVKAVSLTKAAAASVGGGATTATATTTTAPAATTTRTTQPSAGGELSTGASDLATPAGEPENLSRGQRKRLAKRNKYMKREQMILSTLKLRHEEEQSKRIDGLDALRNALLHTTSSGDGDKEKQQQQQNQLLGKTNASKQKLQQMELNHYNLVLQHPEYVKNPFETMQEHLRNTLKRQKEQQEQTSKERTQQLDEQVKKKKQQQMADGGVTKKKKSRKKFKATRTR